uniref:Uncharacterized protein n=1 Tax=Arundo donax TaxID=35708 RepID=A0A0A9D0K8_ARUDO
MGNYQTHNRNETTLGNVSYHERCNRMPFLCSASSQHQVINITESEFYGQIIKLFNLNILCLHK